MPLLDHFHPPLKGERHWEAFHGAWANAIMWRLNQAILPQRYFAEAQIHIGSQVEVDVATLEREPTAVATANGGTGTAVASAVWAPPAPPLVMPAFFPDVIEVQILAESGGLYLVGAVEFVSPANKDRPDTRRAFATKCASYLASGIGLVIVDIVTERLANLHDELVQLLKKPDGFLFPGTPPIYAVAYRPRRREPGGDQVDIWPHRLQVGEELPTLPLALRNGPTFPLELERTYTDARQFTRL